MATEAKYTTDPNQWVNRYADDMFRYALVRVNDDEAARDLVQEAFVSAIRALGSYKGEVPEKHWLITILKNKVIDYYRQKARSITDRLPDYAVADKGDYFEDDGHWIPASGPLDWGGQAADRLEAQEFQQILEKCKSRLREIQQAVFTMKYLDDRDSDEICKELNITSSNYWVIMHRAKLQIRQCLEKNWFRK